MSSLLHPITYWPPGENPTPRQELGRIALKGVSPRGGLPGTGSSKAYLKSDVFEIGGLVADGIHASIPVTAREVMAIDPRKSRRGQRKVFEATLSDYSGDAFFDMAEIWRPTRKPDGGGGFFDELELVATVPCDIVFNPAEEVVADNERSAGRYTVTALRDSGLQTGDSVYVTTREIFMKVDGEVDNPKRGLYLTASLEIEDDTRPVDL